MIRESIEMLFSKPRPWVPPRHLAHVALFTLSVIGGLMGNTHTEFTVAMLLGLAVLAALPHLLKQRFKPKYRNGVQYTVAALGLLWLGWRLTQDVRKEIALIEGLCLVGVSFSVTLRPKHLSYMLLIGAVALIFGSVGPPRFSFLVILPPTVVLAAYLLYGSRAHALAGTDRIREVKTIRKPNLGLIACHMIGILLAWGAVFTLFPVRSRLQSAGIGSWHNVFAGQNQPKRQWRPGDPPAKQERSQQRVQPDAGDVGNFGFLGKDLVMTVKSPLKMYWLASLYDTYDGRTWQASKEMKQQRVFGFNIGHRLARFEQVYTIKKWFSPVLYSAYPRSGRSINTSMPLLERERTFYSEKIITGEFYPKLPFSYRVKSYLPKGKQSPLFHWYEELPQAHYTKLPNTVSTRVRHLAQKITRESPHPYDKAVAIRRYLRGGFEYSLKTKPIPPGREQVDYFLFEMNAGHCEYFAAAMAVLARSVGIPARVATGFAPGKYNAMTDEFEVYEYHAHAWTQVFIEGKGWLTMDATPGSAEQVRNQAGLFSFSSWRNPFSDEWRVRTPETSSDVSRMLQLQAETKKEIQKRNTWILRLFDKKRREYEAFQSTGHVPRHERGRLSLTTKILANAREMVRDWTSKARKFVRTFRIEYIINTIIVLMMLIIVIYITPIILTYRSHTEKLEICEKQFLKAKADADMSPAKCVRRCYRLLRNLLDLAELSRTPSEELLEYAANLHVVDTDLSRHLMAVFTVYDKLLYSPDAPSFKDAEHVIAHTEEAQEYLMKRVRTGNQNADLEFA